MSSFYYFNSKKGCPHAAMRQVFEMKLPLLHYYLSLSLNNDSKGQWAVVIPRQFSRR